jgi:two-component system phosphate regulon sensor histidine kinase PhoR
MSNKFDEQLDLLKTQMIQMGALCEEAIASATKALINGDMELAKKVITKDEDIDHKEKEIESICLKLLLQYQPVARDLRQISSALKMITDMERIGDQAADISEIIMLANIKAANNTSHIADMAKATIKMVTDSIDAYVQQNLKLAKAVIDYDDVVDNLLTKKIFLPLNNLNLEDPLSNDVYDELSPLLIRMAKQNDQIKSQFKKLKEQKEEFNAITENIREGIIVLNNKGLILFINKSAADIFNVSTQDIINKHILTLDRSITLQKAIETAMGGHLFEDIFAIGENSFNLLASPVKDEVVVKGVILFILDVTEKQSAEKMRREFAANVSHELKTPLTSILGYAELMKSGMVKPEDISEFSDRIYNEARHLIDLIEDVIRISRLDEKNVQLPFEEIDLLELAKETVGRLSSLAQQKRIKLSVGGDNAIIFGVRQILEEMIYNLCDNAIKYNYENGKVDVNVKTFSDQVVLTVADNGFGIPREHQSRVFERFYRIDKSHSRETGGTGLGLSIVKHSAEFHNAKIRLMSKPGKGTTITVIFRRNQ